MHDLDLIQQTGSRVTATYRTRDRLALERPQPYAKRRVLVHTISVSVEWQPDLRQPRASVNLIGDVIKKNGTPGLQSASWVIWDRHKPLPAEEQAALDAAVREFKRTFAQILPDDLPAPTC